MKKKKSFIEDKRLTQQDRFNCSVYALNSVLAGPRFVEHFAAFWHGISEDLWACSEQKARMILKGKK